MTRFFVWLCFSVLPLVGEELEIVAYHVGKGMSPQELSFRYYFDERRDDPFGPEGLNDFRKEDEEGKRRLFNDDEIAPLKKAPFESRFFGEGDQIYDVSKHVNFGKGVMTSESQVILNETSGKIVVKAPEMTLMLLPDLFKRVDHPVVATLNLAIYEVPVADLEGEKKRLTRIPRGRDALSEIQLTSRAGGKAIAEGGGLKVTWEPNFGRYLEFVDSRIELGGVVKRITGEVALSWKTGRTTFVGIPFVTELGSFGDSEKTLLVWTSIRVVDGTPLRELEAGKGDRRSALERFSTSMNPHRKSIPKGGGKLLTTFRPHYSLFQFFQKNSWSNEGGDLDPFADDREEVDDGIRRELLLVKDSKIPIPRAIGDHVVNLRPAFEAQAVKFEEGDYAAQNIETGQLISLLSETYTELLDATIGHFDWRFPTQIETSLIVLEGDREFGMDELTRKDVRTVSRLGGVSRPGDSSSHSLRLGELSLASKLSPYHGVEDDAVDLSLAFEMTRAKEVELKLTSEMTLKSGVPQMVQSFRDGEKWRALVVESRVRGLFDDFPE
jgi:hypothetical protein